MTTGTPTQRNDSRIENPERWVTVTILPGEDLADREAASLRKLGDEARVTRAPYGTGWAVQVMTKAR